MRPGVAPPATLTAALDQLDPVAVRVAHEADARALGAASGPVRRLLRIDPVRRQSLERAVEVLDGQRDVVVARPELVGVDPVVVGQLEPRVVTRQPHEHVDRLVPDRHPPALLEPELLVERDRAIDVADAVAGVEVGRHGSTLAAWPSKAAPRGECRRRVTSRCMPPDRTAQRHTRSVTTAERDVREQYRPFRRPIVPPLVERDVVAHELRPDWAIARLAEAQHGVASRTQLLALGLSPD